MLRGRDAIPKPQPLATAEFTTPRMRLIKIAARITETATRVRIAFAAACPEAELFRGVARSLQLAEPWRAGPLPHNSPDPTTPTAHHRRTQIAMKQAPNPPAPTAQTARRPSMR